MMMINYFMRMNLGAPILKILNKSYEPSTLVELRFKRHDLIFRTDSEGRPEVLFIGQKGKNGIVKGERYSRRLVMDEEGNTLKDHWDHKGKAM